MWIWGIIRAGITVFCQSVDFYIDFSLTIDAFFIVSAALVATAPAGLVLFLKRKKAGWVMFVAALLAGAVMYPMNMITKVTEYYRKVSYFVGDEGYDRLLWLAHRTNAVTALTILIMWAIAWWFIRRKSLREIYNVGQRTTILACCLAAVILVLEFAISKNLIRSAEKATKITQIESDEQIVLRYSEKLGKITAVEFPLAFEYRNSSIKKRALSYGCVYREKDWKLFSQYSWDEWERNYIWYRFNGDSFTRDDRYDLPRKQWLVDLSGVAELYVKVSHRLDTASVMQTQFRSYIERMKQAGTDRLSVGTLGDLELLHPGLAKTVLEGDSIRFLIVNRWDKHEAIITLPVEYKY
jgi:hypothetical protein